MQIMQNLDNVILTILIFFPLAAALLIAFIPQGKVGAIKAVMLTAALVEFVLSLHLVVHFEDHTLEAYQFLSGKFPWIKAWNVSYYLGVDWVSVLLIVLSAFLMPIAILGTWNSVQKNIKLYAVNLLVLLSGMIGVFCALDLFLFYVFWEVMLVPMYFLIGIWGGENRGYAAVKFFIYTMAGSLLMLVGILYLYFKAGATFDITMLTEFMLSPREQLLVFGVMALAFAIKVPVFPFHTWLPDAHVQAPTVGSVILAGVLLKMGVYGFFRFAIPLFPDAVLTLQPYLMILAVIGIVYGALVAMVQPDMKKLIAYSSVSHMGVVMLGLFSLNPTGMVGGLYQMINHAISTGGLFLLVGMVYDRSHTRQIKDYSGLAKLMPIFAVLFLIMTFSSIAVPLTNGFVGEFLSLLGSFQVNRGLTAIGASGVILGAVYMLWLVERVFFGAEKRTHGVTRDLNAREILVMLPLVILIVWMGVYPAPFLQRLNKPAADLIDTLKAPREVLTLKER